MAQTDHPTRQAGDRRLVVRMITRMNVGGPSLHVQLLADGLRPFGYDTVLVTGQVSGSEGEMPPDQQKVQAIRRCPQLGRDPCLRRDLRALWWCYRLVRRLQPAIVHTHQAKAGFCGRTAAWLAGVPVIVHTFHGHTFRGYFSARRTRRFLHAERWIARRSTRLIAVGPRVRDELVEEYRIAPPEKVEVIPLGLDLDRFYDPTPYRGRLRDRLGLSDHIPLIGIIGRLAPVKNHELFLQAARRILDRRPDAHFAIIGDGELRGTLESLAARLGLGQSVHFLGWQPRSPALYADLNLLALTSRNEGTPVAVIEAMACGRVCVATDVGGVADVIDDGLTGHLAPPDDAEAFAAACLAALSDPSIGQAMGRRAAEAARKYDQDRLYRDMASLYDRLLAEVHPG